MNSQDPPMNPPKKESRLLERDHLIFDNLASREDRVFIERDHVPVTASYRKFSGPALSTLQRCVERIRLARKLGRPVILAFGAHTIKNGLSPVLIALMRQGWVTHLSTNGAGIIHDWEFAFQGSSSEDVKKNVAQGRFGMWQQTGFYLNLALAIGAFEGLGYGESIGKMISRQMLCIPEISELKQLAMHTMETDPERAAAALDLAAIIKRQQLSPGEQSVAHPYRHFSVQAAAFEAGVQFTGHPMIGCDIIITHPLYHGAAVGRTALTDFLRFAQGISRIEDGVYLSVGSAIMSPMIFEKSFSMAQNLALQENRPIRNHFILVADLAPSNWDWQKQGEPPEDHPAYYQRYVKSFSRMGGEMHYLSADNRDFLLALHGQLNT